MVSRIALFIVAVAAMLVSAGCPQEVTGALALKGPKKYKADVLSCTVNITSEIDNGEVTKATIAKFDGVLAKWQKDMGQTGTYGVCLEIQKSLHEAQDNPGKAFQANQEARANIERVIDYFKTEVPD